MSIVKLKNAVEDLKKFLELTGSEFWIKRLDGIISKLSTDVSRSQGAKELKELFGGMGSLNDLYFCETNGNLPEHKSEKEFNARFSNLMDRVFKELRLMDSGFLARLKWTWLEFKHRGELTPRIKKTFR